VAPASDWPTLVQEDVFLVAACLAGDAAALAVLDDLLGRSCRLAGKGLDAAMAALELPAASAVTPSR
jgi:hypothetical protein